MRSTNSFGIAMRVSRVKTSAEGLAGIAGQVTGCEANAVRALFDVGTGRQIVLATSWNSMQRAFNMRWMTWRATSKAPASACMLRQTISMMISVGITSPEIASTM